MVFGPPICKVRGAPDFEYAFSNRSHFRAFGQFWLSSFQRARRLGGEKKKKECVVKYKSAYILYVGRPNHDINGQCYLLNDVDVVDAHNVA